MRTQLPGIIKVGWLPSIYLTTHIPLKALSEVPIRINTDINWLELDKEGTIEITNTGDPGQPDETATLTFRSPSPLPPPESAFIAVRANGAAYLIGAREKPYPKLETTFTSGMTTGDAAGTEIKIQHRAVKAAVFVGYQSF